MYGYSEHVTTRIVQSILALCHFLRDSFRSVCACLCTGSIFFADVEAIKMMRFQRANSINSSQLHCSCIALFITVKVICKIITAAFSCIIHFYHICFTTGEDLTPPLISYLRAFHTLYIRAKHPSYEPYTTLMSKNHVLPFRNTCLHNICM